MCLGIPMQVKSIDGFLAQCEAKGVTREVSLFMLQGEVVEVGEYVMVHVGYAIQKMSEADARTTWELLDETLAAFEYPPGYNSHA
uniref:Putative hydrogenase assembly chaperone hypC/hupF n=1 Tax=Magnetococcus massalia (strain MO-1) TaxID=451514 RepID=A0A1S7LFZ1_MAGMO|nr:putative hydrogenase assembly chaperone hypC/hupF [Candidatus Magnetococcus massalia]